MYYLLYEYIFYVKYEILYCTYRTCIILFEYYLFLNISSFHEFYFFFLRFKAMEVFFIEFKNSLAKDKHVIQYQRK